MRVSDKMMFDQVERGVTRGQESLYEAQRRAMSGVRVERPSDDPFAASRTLLLDANLEQLESMGRVAGRAQQELGVAESVLGTAGDRMIRVRELLVQSLDGVLSPEDRTNLASEVRTIREEMIQLANSEVAGTYLFGGFRTDTRPFLDDGSFVGTAGAREAEVAPNQFVDLNISGDTIFAPAGGSDVFAFLEQVAIDLESDDTAALELRLGEVDSAREQLLMARSEIGQRLATLEKADDFRQDLGLQIESARSQSVELDLGVAYSDLVRAQSALQAALAQASRILEQMENTIG